MSYSLGVTNTQLSTATITPVALGLVSNYAKTTDSAELARIKNKTASLDQQELITYRSRSIAKVGPDIPVYYPATVQDAVLYSVNVQDILRETKEDGSIADHPIEMWLTVKHDVSAAWTESEGASDPSYVGLVLRRLLGACYTDAGVERFDDLAKSALVPTND
jgi:hypothetical protein